MINNKHRVAYVMSRFPNLSETFILREMNELKSQGWEIELYPLIHQKVGVIHDDAMSWMEKARRAAAFKLLAENLKLLFFHPILYFLLLGRIILGNISSAGFLIRAIGLFPLAVWMSARMKQDEVGHIHAHYGTHPALVAWVVHQITGIPYGITVHAHDIFVDKSMLYRKLKDARYIVAISKFNREYLINLYGAEVGDKINVIHCGVSMEKYARNRTAGVNPSGIFNVFSIGSLQPYKGFTYLLDACEILKREGFSFHCRVVGGGELRDLLNEKLDRLDLSSVIQFLGSKDQDEVADLLSSADCYVQPSIITPSGKMEGIPVSLMEAMASGVPVVATAISGIPELVIDGITGTLVPPEDPYALAEAIKKLYSDHELASRLTSAGRDHVQKEFELSSNVRRLSDLFLKIMYAREN